MSVSSPASSGAANRHDAAIAAAALAAGANHVVGRALHASRQRLSVLRRASSPQLDLTMAVAMPIIESLEGRQLMDGVVQSGFQMTLNGNASSANNFDIHVVGKGLVATVNGQQRWMDVDPRITLVVNGGSGNDTLTVADDLPYSVTVAAGSGNDSIITGAGNDAVFAGAGNDSVKSGAGNDAVFAGTETDTVDAGAGTDVVVDAESVSNAELNYSGTAASSNNSGSTGTGSTGTGSTGTGSTGTTTTPTPSATMPASMKLDASKGYLYVNGSSTSANTIKVTLDSTGSKLLVQCNADAYTFNVVDVKWLWLSGGSGADYIDAGANTPMRADISSWGGNDTIFGTSVGDGLFGGDGNDTIDGRGGGDWIEGQEGNDTLLGQDGNDTLSGGNGNDSLDGGAWADNLIGGDGYDIGINGETLSGIESTTGTSTGTGSTGTGSTGTGSTGTGSTGNTGNTGNTGTGSTGTGSTGSGTTGSGTTATGAGIPPVTGNVAAPVARITTPVGTTITAGQAFHADGINSTLNAGQVITARYEWDFGDTTAGSRLNKLVGFNASHVYDTPGTYTVTLRVINEGGKTSTTTTNVTVVPDQRSAIYISYYGNDNNDGSSANTPIRSWNRAVALLGSNSNVKILFARGQTFDVSTTELWINGSNVTIGAYGSGANPVLRYVGPRDRVRNFIVANTSSSNVNIENLTFDSMYTYDTEETNMPTSIFTAGKNVTVRGNQFLNVGMAMNVGSTTMGLTALDNTAPSATGIRAYFMWVEGTNIVALGNTVANSTREHIIRMSGASRMLISNNTMTNMDRSNVDGSDTAKGVVAAQKGSYYYVASNRINGPAGFGPLGAANGMGDTGARTLYGVYEQNFQTGYQFEVRHGGEHIMVRNNVFDRDNGAAISLEGFDTAYNRGSTDIEIFNNTGINRGTTGNFLRMIVPVDGVKLVNNLYVAPQLSIGGWGAAPVNVVGTDLSSFTQIDTNNWGMPTITSWAQGGINIVGTSDASSVFQGVTEWNNMWPVGTDLFVTATLDGNYKPTSNAGTGTALGGVFTDYYGNYRPSSGWTIGAVQA